MARFKVVKHRLKYHVIGFTGTKTPRKKGAKATYKEQCLSSHWTIKGANKALDKYKLIKLDLSSKPEQSVLVRLFKELHIGLVIAIACGIMFEAGVKFLSH